MAAPSLLSRLVRALLLRLYRQRGWHLEGTAPTSHRFLIVGAPHTSSWDFIFFIGATHSFGIAPHFMGKNSLFRWPLRRFMLDMGGVPVDRSAPGGYAQSMIDTFAAHDDFALVIAPEGTRKEVRKWRSGFYHIALGAGVPVVCAWVDNQAKRGGLGPEMVLSGDYGADMARIAGFYRAKMPGHPKWTAFDAVP